MDVFLDTLGCRLNEAELERWHRDLTARGDRVVGHPRDAQVIVLNTCAVTGVAGRKSRKHVNRLHRKNPTAQLVVTGCYAEMDRARVEAIAGVDLVIGNREKRELPELLHQALEVPTMPRSAIAPSSEASHVFATARTRAFLKIQDGCRNRCTFCIVTVLRGDERSETIETLVEQVRALDAEGYQEVVLTGVHIGGYGADVGSDLRGLVRAILEETDIPRVRLASLEPWDLPPDFFTLWENPRLQPHLHLPLQSGCDATLKRMSRRCSTAEYRALVASAREAIPDLTLTTDVIGGFPGETEEEWRATYAFVEEMDFAHAHIFTYSAREGTKAARLPGRVAPSIQRERSQALHALVARSKRAHLDRFVGTLRPVLWEGEPDRSVDGPPRWTGYTDNYLRVSTRSDRALENVILPARLDGHDGAVYAATPG